MWPFGTAYGCTMQQCCLLETNIDFIPYKYWDRV